MPFSAADLANITKANPYIQRLIEDAEAARQRPHGDRLEQERLRAPDERQGSRTEALLEDKKLHEGPARRRRGDPRGHAALTEAPKKRKRKRRLGRKLLILVARRRRSRWPLSEKLRSKVLDTLFGAEEEFQYTPPRRRRRPAGELRSAPPSAGRADGSCEGAPPGRFLV